MAGVSYTDPLFAAQAGAATDWGSVDGGVLVKLPVQLELNRGLAIELGIEAMASLDAEFSKFLTAELAAHGQLQAGIRGQIQMPMNLFREVGFAVRLQAILEAAAGVRVGLGINLGDFVTLAQGQLQLRGLPMTLFRIFLEEVDIGASLSAKIAFTAQAYANLVATGTLVGDSQTRPGFNFVFGYGYGFKGGYGIRMVARAGLRDVSRFVARSVDATVDHTIDELIDQMPAQDLYTPALLDAARAPAKIAFRIGYELGEYIVRNSIPMTADGANRVALRCVQVVLEEAQRYLLRKMVDVSLDAITAYLQNAFEQVDQSVWDSVRDAREQLASRLQAMPAEPFDLRDGSTRGYWNDIAVLLTNLLINVVGESSIPPPRRRDLATVWSAVQLMFAATERIVRTQASVSVIGLAPATAKASFAGPLPSQPHALIAQVIRDAVPTAGATLTQQDLLEFLTGTVALDALRSQAPEIDSFLEGFVGRIAPSANDVARLMMTSLGSVMKDANGNFDDVAALREFAFGLRLFLVDKFEADVVPMIRAAVPDYQPEMLMVVDEVLVPSMHMVMDSCFDQVVGWASGQVSQKVLEESLSSVIMAVIGRTLVLTGDVMMAATQEQTVDILQALAREPGAPPATNQLIAVPSGFPESAAQIIAPAVSMSEADVADALREFLLISADVARPFPPEVRRKLRSLMYEVIAPLPPENPASLAQSLKNDLWIPNEQAMKALGQELMLEVGGRLVAFSVRLLERLGEIAVEQLQEAIDALVTAVTQWIESVAASIQLLGQRLAEIALELNALLASIEGLVNQALDRVQLLFNAMGGRRNALRNRVVSRLTTDATAILVGNPVYMILPPGVKNTARQAMSAVISSAIENRILDPVFDAVSMIANDLNSLLDDVRALDPNTGLVSGIHALLLDRVRQRVLTTMGGSNPGIDVAFGFSWTSWTLSYEMPSFKYIAGRWIAKPKQEFTSINLGRVELPVTGLFDMIADAIMSASTVEQRITALAQSIHALLIAELEELALKTEREVIDGEKAQLEEQRSLCDLEVRGVEIVEPVTASVHGYSVRAELVIEGAPPSFVASIPDVPDRVLICLDGEPMALSRFSVKQWSAGPVVHRDDLGIDRNPALRGRPSMAVAPLVRGEHDGATAIGNAVGRQTGLRQGIASSMVHSARNGSERAILASLASLGTGQGTASLFNVRSGCVLTTTIPLSQLDEGFHTLVITVVDGAGREFRDVVSFVVENVQLKMLDEKSLEPTRPAALKPGREDIQPKRNTADGSRRKKIFPTRAERAARTKRALDTVTAKRTDPVKKVAMLSVGTRAAAVRRYPQRHFDPVVAVGIERQTIFPDPANNKATASATVPASSRKGKPEAPEQVQEREQ